MPMDPSLFEAAKNGNDDHSRIKFENVNPLNQLTVRKDTILHVAVKYGNKIAAHQILNTHLLLVHETNLNGDTPLHMAARLGHSDLVKLIVIHLKKDPGQAGMHPLRTLNKKNHTALHEAVKNEHCDVVNCLIEEDQGLAGIKNGDESPLFMAVERGFHNIADSILSCISDWSASYGSGRDNMTVMHAAALGLFQRSTIANRINIWANNSKLPSLELVFICFPLVKLIYLMSKLRRLVSKHLRSQSTCQEFASKLVENCGAEILEEKDKFGRTALHYAAYVGNVRVVELFLDKNRSLAYIKDDKGMSAMHISAMKGHTGVINELAKRCPDVCELLDNNNQTPLHVAVRSGRYDTVCNFLYGSDCFDGIMLNEQDKEGNTPLHVAALSGHLEILTTLAEDHRVEKKVINRMGMTAADIIQSSTQLPILYKRWMVRFLAKLGENERLENTLDDEITRASLLHECHPPQSSIITSTKSGDKEDEEKHVEEDLNKKKFSWDKNLVEVNLLVATIIASITFGAAISMPGGYNSDGMANLRRKLFFKIFVVLDSMAFGFAAASMIIHFLFVSVSKIFGSNVAYPIKMIMLLTYLSVGSAVFALSAAFHAVLEQESQTHKGISLPATCATYCFIIPVIIYAINMIRYRHTYFFMHTRMCIKASMNRMTNHL